MPDQPTFAMPQGFFPPENRDANDEFQAMCTLQVVDNTTLKLIDVEGYALGKEEVEEAEEKEPGQGEAAGGPPTVGTPLAGAALGGAAPTPGGPGPGPNMSADQLAAGAGGQRVGGYAERLAQQFRRATRRR